MMSNFEEPLRKENIPRDERKQQALERLAYLWRTDSPDWNAQRDSDWKLLSESVYDETPRPERECIEAYFKYGESPKHIPISTSFFLTPYESVESLELLFNSGVLSDNDRRSILSYYIFSSTKFAECDWYERHTTLFVETLLGDQYCEIYEVDSSRVYIISPLPTLWCLNFCKHAIRYVDNNIEWHPIYLCIDYLITALPFALDDEDRGRTKLLKLLELVTTRLAEGTLSGRLLTFASELKSREQEILKAWDIGEQKLAAMDKES
ncbi:hypothetical protein L2750_17920 [Shewanella submarina]|uniref:Uncharacterized protein n=1 Tax=Shewanella submarina TaxID=2016376 RepID=A0ABV7GFI5_9GAMM|nr:hypothetical protein [Shewanella submarina]MCL1039011.1 hypothetical protein [Shewanella submarina]